MAVWFCAGRRKIDDYLIKGVTLWSVNCLCCWQSVSGNCFLSTCDEWLLPTWNCLANGWICVHCGLMCLVYSARLSARVCLPTLLLSNNTLYFLRLLPNGDNTKWRSPKNGKNWGFSPSESNRINRSRRNLARKRRPWVCYSTPNLAVIGKGGLVQQPQKMSNLPKIVVFGHRKPKHWTHSDEIVRVSVGLGSAVAHESWPLSVKGVGAGAPKMSEFAQNCGFWPPEAEKWTHSDEIWR